MSGSRRVLTFAALALLSLAWPAKASAAMLPAGAPDGGEAEQMYQRRSYRQQLGRVDALAAEGVALQGPYSDWSWPEPGYFSDIEETLAIEDTTTPGAPFYWAHQFSFEHGACTGVDFPCQGYLGLQDSSFPSDGKIALFSIWDANAAQGDNCSTFTGEGDGYSCKLAPYDWEYERDYVLRVTRDGSGSQGAWYKATVTDTVTGEERTIGRIRVPRGWGGIQGWTSWTEYFGAPPSSCAGFPKSRVRWKFPAAGGGSVSITGDSTSFGPGDCASRVDAVPGGHRQVAPK